MKLSQLLSSSLIKMELSATDKRGVFEELVGLLMDNGLVKDKDEALARIEEREVKMSTGISHWLALPHVFWLLLPPSFAFRSAETAV